MTERPKKNINEYPPGLYHCESSSTSWQALILRAVTIVPRGVIGPTVETIVLHTIEPRHPEDAQTSYEVMHHERNAWDYCTPVTELSYAFVPPPVVPERRTVKL